MKDIQIRNMEDENTKLRIENKNLNDMLNAQFDGDGVLPKLNKMESLNECTICVEELSSDIFENTD